MSNVVVLRTVYALNSNTGQFLSSGQVLLTNGLGGTFWTPATSSLILSGGEIMNNLPSSISTVYVNSSNIQVLSTVLYSGLSTLSVAISQTAGTISQSNLASSIQGLGSSGYTSTATVSTMIGAVAAVGITTASTISTIAGQISSYGIPTQSTMMNDITSTTQGLGKIGYISSTQLTSSVKGLLDNISSLQVSTTLSTTEGFASTVSGLASSRYVSSSQLTSTIVGLGSRRYVSSSQLASTIVGIGSSGYVSSSHLASTTVGLGQTYLSSALFTSTANGLGSLGYISSQQLLSTFDSLSLQKANIRFDTTTSVTTVGSINYFNTIGTIIFISSFFQSSIVYSGNNQALVGTNAGTHDMYFSTAAINFSQFSSFIDSNSRLTLDIYPTIAFSKLGTGATTPVMLYMSSFLQVGNNAIYPTTTTSWFFAGNTTMLTGTGCNVDSSNIYNQPIKMTIPQNTVNKAYLSTFALVHYLPSSLNNGALQNALHSSTITPFFASTNSLYLSVQNLP